MERLCASNSVVDHIRRFVSDYGFNTARVDGPCERISAVSLLRPRFVQCHCVGEVALSFSRHALISSCALIEYG